jgi:transposase
MVKRNHSSLGIDLSDKTLNFCRMTAGDGVVAEGKVALTAAKVAGLWREHGQVDVVVLEAGTPSTWVNELLEELGARVIVADPRKLQAVTSAVRKSDKRDARMLARLGLADEELLAPTYVRAPEHRRAMVLLKARDQQVRMRTATVLEIRSMVKLEGSRMPKCDAEALHKHADAVPDGLRDVLGPLFETLGTLASSIGQLDELVEEEGRKFPVVAKLSRIAGVGPITALAFVAVVGDPARFHRTRDIGAYLGLVPRRDQSGQSDPSRRISKAGCGFLRRLLVQCGQVVCRPSGKDSAQRRWAHARLAEVGKTGKRRVVVAVARRLAVLMLSLWKSGQEWQPLHRVAAAPVVDAPQPVVLDECGLCLAPNEGATENAPSTATRTHTCTEGLPLTKSADGSAGRSGASTTGRRAPKVEGRSGQAPKVEGPSGRVPKVEGPSGPAAAPAARKNAAGRTLGA